MYTSSPGWTATGGQWPERGVSRDLPLISIRRVSKYQRRSLCVLMCRCVSVCEQSHSCAPIIWQVHSFQVYFYTEGHPRGVGRVAWESSRGVTSVITSRKTETTLSLVSPDVWVRFGDRDVVCFLPGCCQNWPKVKQSLCFFSPSCCPRSTAKLSAMFFSGFWVRRHFHLSSNCPVTHVKIVLMVQRQGCGGPWPMTFSL